MSENKQMDMDIFKLTDNFIEGLMLINPEYDSIFSIMDYPEISLISKLGRYNPLTTYVAVV